MYKGYIMNLSLLQQLHQKGWITSCWQARSSDYEIRYNYTDISLCAYRGSLTYPRVIKKENEMLPKSFAHQEHLLFSNFFYNVYLKSFCLDTVSIKWKLISFSYRKPRNLPKPHEIDTTWLYFYHIGNLTWYRLYSRGRCLR